MRPTVLFRAPALLALSHFDLTDELENGGGLYGLVQGHRVEVLDACQSVSRRERLSTLFDARAIKRNAGERATGGLEIVGTWHTHPDGLARPSDADKHSWRGWTKNYGKGGLFVGVIIARRSPAEQWHFASASRAFVLTHHGGVMQNAMLRFERFPNART